MADVILDFGGRPIEPGDLIAYPVRAGSEMWLRSMRVASIKMIRSKTPVFHLSGANDAGHLVCVEHPERCVILEKGQKSE